MSYKQERVIVIVSEFVNDKREYYPITDVPVEKARFFYKDDDGLFKVMSSSDYAVRTETNETRLYITNEKIKNESSKFQMGYEINFSASEYETSLPVLSVLVEMYNTLIEDSRTIFNYVKKQCFISDDKTTGLILPNLPPHSVWCMGENNKMYALPVSELYGKFQQMINSLYEAIKKLLDKDYTNFSETVKQDLAKHLTALKNKTDEYIGTLKTETDNQKVELDNYTLSKIEEIKNVCDRIIGLAFNKLTTANTIEQLKTMNFLKIGDIVEVLGYYSAGDGAGHKRIIKAEDDGSGVQVANNLWANIIKSDIYHSNWFGANKSGDVTDIFKKMIAYNKPLIVNQGEYNLSEFIFDTEKIIKENNGTYPNKKIIFSKELSQNLPMKTPIGIFDYKGIMTPRGHQSVAYNRNKQEYILGFTNTDDEQSTLIFLDKNFSFIKKVNIDLGHCNGLTYNPKTNKLIAGGYLGSTAKAKQIFVLNYDTQAIEKTVDIGYDLSGIGYDEEKDLYMASSLTDYSLLDSNFNIIKTVKTKCDNNYENLVSQDTEFFNGNFLTFLYYPYQNCTSHIFSYDLKGDFKNHYVFDTRGLNDEPEGIFVLGENRLLITEYIGTTIRFYELDFSRISLRKSELIPTYENKVFVDSNAENEGNGSYYKPFKTIRMALNSFNNSDAINLELRGEFEEDINIDNINCVYIHGGGENTTIVHGKIAVSDILYLYVSGISFQPRDIIDRILFCTSSTAIISNCEFIQPNKTSSNPWGARGVSFYRTNARILGSKSRIENCSTAIVCSESAILNVVDITTINNNYRFMINGGIILHGTTCKFDTKKDEISSDGIISPNDSNKVSQLNTLYHMEKMKQENVYDDYISYMDEKTLYDKQQRKLEQERQLAYEEALKENPELTYEEFMSLQPMMLNLMEEPQPSENLKKFIDKYL